MVRGVRLFLVGSLVLVSLAGCGRSWFAEREPWRREAEIACLKSGSVKESAAIAQVAPISGPGLCGADFPLKVAALGESAALGFVEPLRPPAGVPVSQGRLPSALRDPPPAPGPPLILGPGRPGEQGHGADGDDEPDDAPARGWSAPRRLPAAMRVPLSASPRVQALSARAVEITPPATLACPLVSALEDWLAQGVQPAALRWFGQPVAEIKQISAYSCRGMNGQRGAKISEHAFGNALDIAAFTLADGRRITVREGWRGLPEERAFLRDVQSSACERFSTVLGPGSNIYHYDHLHVDLMRRPSGRAVCNPEPVAGELVAAQARASARNNGGSGNRWSSRGGSAAMAGDVTSSVGRRMLPKASPGED